MQECQGRLCVPAAAGGVAGGSVEAVLIPMLHRKGTRRHITLCVSSQVSAHHDSTALLGLPAQGSYYLAVTQTLWLFVWLCLVAGDDWLLHL